MRFMPLTPQPEYCRWGTALLPESEAVGHFLAVGAPGSGKSLMLQLLMQSVLPQIQSKPDRRAIIYDAKQNLLPLLSAICPNVEIITTHPLDERGAAWDLTNDVNEPILATEVGFTLFPENSGESQPFFADAARNIAIGVMNAFILSNVEWGLGTLIRVLKNVSWIKQVLRRHPETRSIVEQYFSDKRLLHSIISTIASKIVKYEPLAAAWEHATKRFSITKWLKSNQIIVLGNCESARSAMDAINRCIFKRAADLTINLADDFERRNWFIFDELSEAGYLDGLVSLLKKSRSKGGCCALATQSISGLRDERMYGQHFTDEIMGMAATKFFGRIECPTTAQWVSELFGDQERVSVSQTFSTSQHDTSRSTTKQKTIQPMVLPSELMSLPTCNRTNGLTGYYITRTAGAFRDNVPGATLFDEMIVPEDSQTPNYMPRPAMNQFLRECSPAEMASLGIERKAKRQKKPELKKGLVIPPHLPTLPTQDALEKLSDLF